MVLFGLFPRTHYSTRRRSSLAESIWRQEKDAFDHIPNMKNPQDQRALFVSIIDRSGFNFKVFLVASSGFLTDSFNLFASNVTLPALAYVYWGVHSQATEITINALTLAGSMVGQVMFGVLADVYGRQRLYGIELLVVIVATLGLATSGPGIVVNGDSSMSVTSLLMFFRFLMGIGIGAEYKPLSACITAEWSAKTSRAQMMSAVFFCQPFGQLLAYSVGLVALHGLNKPFGLSEPTAKRPDAAIGVDILWRVVSGVGGVPALFALVFRFLIPESGRWTCDMKQDAETAIIDTRDGTQSLFNRSIASGSRERQNRSNPDDIELGPVGPTNEVVEGIDWAASDRNDSHDNREPSHRGPEHEDTNDSYDNYLAYHDASNGEQVDESNESPLVANDVAPEESIDDTTNNLPDPHEARSYQDVPNNPGSEDLPVFDRASSPANSNAFSGSSDGDPNEDEIQTWTQFEWEKLVQYFWTEGNWRYLFGVSVCWWLLDFAFYGTMDGQIMHSNRPEKSESTHWARADVASSIGLGFNNPGTLAKLWTAHSVDSTSTSASWLLNSAAINGSGSIFEALNRNGIESIVTVSIWSLIGCGLMTFRIKVIDRRFTVIWTSVVLSVLLFATAIAFPYLFHKSAHVILIVLYAAIQFFFSYGPNTLLFIIPAEIFPTRYRCTCYGIAAASGKLGAVCVQIVYIYFSHRQLTNPNSPALGNLMYIFASFMLLVAFLAWAYLPHVQDQQQRPKEENTCVPAYVVPNKTLEELGEGRAKVENDAEKVGLRNRSKVAWKSMKAKFS